MALMAATLYACDAGGGGSGGSDWAETSANPYEMADTGAVLTASAATPQRANRKLIRTASLELIVADYDATRGSIDTLLERTKGFVSTVHLSYEGRKRVVAIVLRTPASTLDATLSRFKALGRVTRETLETADATTEYVDTDARLRNLGRTEKRLLDVLEGAQGELSEILTVESELDRVRGEVEQLTARIKQLDESVALSTVHLDVREDRAAVVEEPDDLWRPLRELWDNAGALIKNSIGILVTAVAGVGTAIVLLFPLARHFRRRARSATTLAARCGHAHSSQGHNPQERHGPARRRRCDQAAWRRRRGKGSRLIRLP